MSILQASFFWRNDKPNGIGITFGPPGFTASDLEMMFLGEVHKKFQRDSDGALGSNIVSDMLEQLAGIGNMKAMGDTVPSRLAVLAALNIQWLTSRGFIPNDEFNGVRFDGVKVGV